MGDAIVLKYEISPDDFTRAGEASSDVKGKLKQLGVSPEAYLGSDMAEMGV